MVKRLLEFNGIAILGVLLFHSAGWGFIAMFSWAARYTDPAALPGYNPIGSPGYYLLRLFEQLAVFCIPGFLFVSGYFVSVATGRSRPNVPWSIIRSRLQGLLIPYLIWSFLLFLFLGAQGKWYTVAGYARMLLVGGANPAYYYVPLLSQFYLLSRLLVPPARTHWPWLLAGAGALQLAVQLLYYPALLGLDAGRLAPIVDVMPKWFFGTRIFWFSLGIVAGFHIRAFREWAVCRKRLLFGAAILLIPLGMIEWEAILRFSGQLELGHRETLLDTLYAAAVILGFIALDDRALPGSSQLRYLGAHSFGIYLAHSPVMEIFSRGLYHLAPWLLGQPFLLQPLLWMVGLGVPLALMALVRRSPAQRYYRYLFG